MIQSTTSYVRHARARARLGLYILGFCFGVCSFWHHQNARGRARGDLLGRVPDVAAPRAENHRAF